MTVTVNIFFHEGIAQANVASGTRYTTDSVGTLKQPYIGRASVTCDAFSGTSCTAAPNKSQMMHVQVPEGSAVFVEINPPNREVEADTQSPRISGDQTFIIGPNWSASFREAV
jgi:hypothetical protein